MTASTVTTSPVETLFATLNLSAYTPEEQEQLLTDISDTIFQGTLTRLIERMDTATRGDFNELMDHDASGDEVASFLKKRVPGAENATLEAVREVTEDIAALKVPEEAS